MLNVGAIKVVRFNKDTGTVAISVLTLLGCPTWVRTDVCKVVTCKHIFVVSSQRISVAMVNGKYCPCVTVWKFAWPAFLSARKFHHATARARLATPSSCDIAMYKETLWVFSWSHTL